LDVIGAFMVFHYGLPNRESELYRPEFDANLEKKIESRSKWGLGLIIFGFFLQLISNIFS